MRPHHRRDRDVRQRRQLRADVLEAHALCHQLQLVTCGGTFDTTTRSYLSNIVAYTTLTTTTTTTTAS